MTAPVLTPRQLQVLELMAEGLTRPQIAARLWLGVETVATHQQAVYAHMGVHSGPAAVAAGYAAGLLHEPATTNEEQHEMTDRIHAPWTEPQIVALNAYQRSGVMHPFTCGNDEHRMRPTLIAERDGWRCPDDACDYLQTWAHAFMADTAALANLEQAHITPPKYAANPLAAELMRKEKLLRETEDQLAQARRRIAELASRLEAVRIHEAIVRIPAQPPDPDGGLCEPILYDKPIRDVPTGGVL